MTLRRDGADGEPVSDPELRRSRLRALLAYLVSHRQTTRSAVAAALWPDLDEKAAVNNLGVTLNLLRRVLEPWRHSGEPPFLLRLDGQVLRLVTGEHLHLDVDAFDQHLAAAQQAESDGIPSLALEHDLAAVDLYRGDLFADLVEADWCTLDREHYRIHFVGAAIRAGQLLLGRGEPDRAEAVARRALAVDRWAEDAYAVLVGAAMARRDRAGAHRMYSHCVDALGELGAQPSEALRQLERRLQTATL
jgi:DNA-binding SARP family transcriptional activator